MIKDIIIILLGILILSGCGEINTVFQKSTPYQEYKESLEKAGLLNTALGKEWLAAGETALKDSSLMVLPYQEKGYFPSNKIRSASVRFEANRGEVLQISIEADSVKQFLIFADLFIMDYSNGLPELVISKEKYSSVINYQVTENGTFLLRIQPELLKSGEYELKIIKSPSLAFPVPGMNSLAIKSFWGDSRDGGSRKHKGVDIFAPKGTPVTAVADGIITRTGSNKLGGKVVWLSALKFNFYYAHLDSQIVNPGAIIKSGDTLGLIGNTGNARFTPPHLHFGIYASGEGAINPYPFIKDDYTTLPALETSPFSSGQLVRLNSNVELKLNPYKKSSSIAQLKKNTPVEILSRTSKFLRVVLPDQTTGFIQASSVSGLDGYIMTYNLSRGKRILELPDENKSTIAVFETNQSVQVYGSYNGYHYIRINEDFGWIGL